MSAIHDDFAPAPLAAVDLNLFIAFDAIARERNLTRAALRLSVTQSAMSHALRRLRQLFGDELLVRGTGGMVLTPRAEALIVPVQSGLATLARALVTPARFEAARARRAFRLAAPDLFDLLVIPPLLERLRASAPLVDLGVVPLDDRVLARQLETGQLDLAVTPVIERPAGVDERAPSSGLVRRVLFRDHFTCLMRRGHPALRRARGRPKALELDDYAALSHVLVSPTGEGPGVMEAGLAARGKKRRVALRVPHFASALAIVAKSDLVLTAPTVLGRFARSDVTTVGLPSVLGVAAHAVQMVWHERFTQDPAHVWLREQLVAVAAAIGPNANRNSRNSLRQAPRKSTGSVV